MPSSLPRRAAVLFVLCSTLAAPASAEEVADVRLSHDAVPTYQHVSLRLDPDKRGYSGRVRVELDVKRATNHVDLHAEGQKLVRVSLVQRGDTLAVETKRGDRGLLTLAAARPLRPGPASLEIEFTGFFGTRAVGLYRVVKDGRGYLFTQFEADECREAFPCWDEPGFKFPYQFTLEVPSGQEAVTNTPIERRTEQDGWQTLAFARTKPLSSYLLAIAVGPFEFTPVPGTRFPVRIVTCAGMSRLTGTTVELTPKLLTALERWFGIPYPYEKLDMIAVPEFAYGAMENAGAITYREDLLLLDRATATVSQRRRNANVTCHELAHMWFGDYVTMQWWDDLWLNESFADWMASKITDQVHPEFKDLLSAIQEVQRVKKNDARPTTRAIRSPTTSAAAGLENVGLVYNKGNAVLRMFEQFLGPETFQKGVRAYLESHAFGNATAADLWAALDRASRTNVSGAMATYTDQPGVPFLRVTPEPGGVRITQSRSSPHGVSQAPVRWRIPVGIRYPAGGAVRTQRLLLAEESVFVPLAGGAPAWVMPNADGFGYYAWSTPPAMMAALAAVAREAMTPAERIAFVGNLELLLDMGELHGDTYLAALAPFGSDPEPRVVSATIENLAAVRRAFVPDSAAPAFAVYVRRTLGPALERFGFEPRPGEEEAVSEMRGELLTWLARRGEAPEAIAFADAQARRYLADSAAVDPGIADAVLGLAARRGDAALFDELRRRYEAATIPALRSRYLRALGAFGDPALEAKALEYALSDAVRPTELFQIVQGFALKDEAATDRLFRWMTGEYDRIAARIPPPALRFMPRMGSGCSAERLAATKAFFSDPKRNVPGVEQSLERVSDDVNTCIGLREREGAAVNAYLRSLAGR